MRRGVRPCLRKPCYLLRMDPTLQIESYGCLAWQSQKSTFEKRCRKQMAERIDQLPLRPIGLPTSEMTLDKEIAGRQGTRLHKCQPRAIPIGSCYRNPASKRLDCHRACWDCRLYSRCRLCLRRHCRKTAREYWWDVSQMNCWRSMGPQSCRPQ